ncbi:MAG: hypothetical protein A2937_03430 [Candidatus Yonathbacteria bacterium RIFCSPLOWO2_01_FULL_47_33b]|uniref:Uncharacterized protein n=1 Tax=Candidatus Yonathbacteria bacterium RIFCSPLOWO2_01_FULL_47_33b TaxID=1802727 RepID=A0A1G2SH46_9BACT|nr:MAG: hypothetical protein A2937_03430 [Candidatus Yonathbacteria bacterium RIFCSPLOWO2_01_FULL_47_33b]
MGNNTQNSVLTPLTLPFVLFARIAAKKVRAIVLRIHPVNHYASCKEGKIGLAELVRHRGSMMETLYERRKILPSGQVVVQAHFRFIGDRAFPGGNKKFIQPGDVISAEFIVGRNKGEFLIAGGSKDTLPKHALLYWQNPKSGPGSITPIKK